MDFQELSRLYHERNHPGVGTFEHVVLVALAGLLSQQATILGKLALMATAQEVKDALTAETARLQTLSDDLVRVATDITNLKNAGGASPADLDDILTTINGHVDTVGSIQTNIDAVDPAAIVTPPAPPAP